MRLRNHRTPGARGRLALLALPAVLAIGLFGCDDFLTTEPRAQLTTDNFFTSEAQAIQATNATYAMLRNWSVHVFSWLGVTEIVSDDATKGSVPADAGFLLDVDNLNFDPGNGAFGGPWTGYYQGIYRANIAIANIPEIDMNESLRARLVGENQFLRAYYYFFLVRAFGGVPLITEPLEPGEYFQDRASAEAVYTQIEQDLTDAIAVLPERSEYAPSQVGRASKGAARALLAKVHLFQEEYAPALEQAQAVINSGQYSLYPDYSGIFTPQGENSSETVFSVQTIAVEGGNAGPGGGASQYAQVQGVRGFPNLGWGFNNPSPDLESSYEPGDPRLEATIMYPWEIHPFSPEYVVWLNESMPNNRYNQKVTQSVDNPGGSGNAGVNIRRIRYADVLLMAAEAAQRTGNDGLAQQYLNQVRQRARGDRAVTLGIQTERLDPGIATEVLGLSTNSRVFVRYVGPDTDAYAAGLRGLESARDNAIEPIPVAVQNLDIITAVDGTPVTTPEELEDAVSAFGPGATVTLDVVRVTDPSGATTTLTVDVPVMALLPDVTAGGQALLEAIWRERRHELAMEQHRWFDIVRQGRADQLMESLTCADRAQPEGCAPLVFEEGTHELYPIPAGEVAVAGLTQNPGY